MALTPTNSTSSIWPVRSRSSVKRRSSSSCAWMASLRWKSRFLFSFSNCNRCRNPASHETETSTCAHAHARYPCVRRLTSPYPTVVAVTKQCHSAEV